MLKRVSWTSWTTAVPLVALVALAVTWSQETGPVLAALEAAFLTGAVLAAVHHAEVVAHRVGEPFGSVVLAAAVTVIEVSLIVTLMASGGNEAATLARDTVFAAVMITMNGITGLSLLLGSHRYGVTLFNPHGSGAALATLITLATLSLVLPTFTTSHGARNSHLASSPSPRSPRYCSTCCSSSLKRCGIAIFFCRSHRRVKEAFSRMEGMRSRRAPGRR